ncbi:MAG TPA: amidohydrolase family protein [Bryobacteraceae bacterium]|jgi:Tol biopolymer transport system component/imidazolonepropionase-like amidohydrolase|nr:amidohydrolase family protein [Bryobacteraceae bacterium]
MRPPRFQTNLIAATALLASALTSAQTVTGPALRDVTVSEGTSMSVAASPDGLTLAIDMQGSIWTLPASGGTAKRITTLFNDARQPVWSPDGKWIAFFGYLDGGYDIWAVAPDGSNQHKLTSGPYDDREPAYSHDGARLAFSSDRGDPLGGSYNIWTLDLRSGELKQITSDSSENRMPGWSPDDSEIVFASTRDGGNSVWAVRVADGQTRKVSTAAGTVDAPSWSPGGKMSPGGKIVYHSTAGNGSRLEADGISLTGDENAFAFRVSWVSSTEFFYVSDGKIRRRSINGGTAQTIPFQATMQVTRAAGSYTRRKRDFDSVTPRRALGIVRPVISPDGKKVAFAALGDIYVESIGEAGNNKPARPENLTNDKYLDTDPAWSPDGNQLVYSSDKGGSLLQLWIRDMRTGQSRQLTNMTTQPQGAAWSPDGKRIAFFDVDAMWRAASVSVVDVASGKVTKIHNSLFGPGMPAWSPDGRRIALAMVAPYSKSFREGTNQILTMSADNGAANSADRWFAPVPNLSIDSRGFCGPVWSPDGTKMAAIYEGVLAVWPVAPSGEPLGPPRHMTSEIAYSPSWAGDSRHILYQTLDELKTIDILSGETREVPLDLKYTPSIPKGRIVVHAGQLVDGRSQSARRDVDILIEGNRIRSVSPHTARMHAGRVVVDASNLTAMPGLVEYHSHLQKDFGEAEHRAWLSFGITTVRSPGDTPYEIVEDREANESGVRPGPRIFGTGYLMEWGRVYYKMGIALSGPAHFEMELQLAKVLQHDLIKSYVRLPDLQQRRMVEFAHGIGVPVTTHEIYPAAYVGVDGTEHTAATSRRGYSPKAATLQRSYEDVIQLFGQSGRFFCPMIPTAGTRKLLADEPSMRSDPRFNLYPAWLRAQATAAGGRGGGEGPGAPGKMVMDAMHAGAIIVAGTDTPNAFNLHGELETYVLAGMTPYEALKTATVNAAQALNLDAGSIEPGKLADIVIVDGNPLEDIANAHKVKRVIANGRLYELEDLVKGNTKSALAPQRPPRTRSNSKGAHPRKVGRWRRSACTWSYSRLQASFSTRRPCPSRKSSPAISKPNSAKWTSFARTIPFTRWFSRTSWTRKARSNPAKPPKAMFSSSTVTASPAC